ncbi:3-methyl-2-oxobutanoate hydroxymethyltransferase [bacterium]|nr:3-methyl-2-oxobutanoate hydroxymethyltransferase [bacterium]
MAAPPVKKVTAPGIRAMKGGSERIVSLTAYDFVTAGLVDQAGADIILVGDSAAMVVLGHESTLPVTVDEMVMLTAAVARAKTRALVVGDLPFMSYQADVADAVRTAGRFVKDGGASAVKLEGGAKVVDRVRAIIDAGIPVMGHIGLTPQSVHEFGGYRIQGRSDDARARLLEDARALDDAGCFSIVLEAMPSELGAEITQSVSIPTIGIGAGPDCDGQVLVINDILGYTSGHTPKFVRSYGDARSLVLDAARRFAADVRSGAYPNDDESY